MHKDNHHSPTAIAYAKALFELAQESSQTAAVVQELRDIRQAIDTLPMFGPVMSDPAVSSEERKRVLHNSFSGRVSPLLLKFIGLLNQKGKIGLLAAITGAFEELQDVSAGVVEVDITVAERLNPEQLESVRQSINHALKMDAVVHQYVDASIMGGMILRVRDQLIDGSIKTQLASMRRHLLAHRPQYEPARE